MPLWLDTLSIACLLLGLVCAVFVAADVARRPQRMWIMAVVWPVTALFATVPAIWLYFHSGRAAPRDEQHAPHGRGGERPFPATVAIGTTHCGAGCALGDIVAEWLAFFVPVIAVWFGWRSLFAEKMFAVWIVDFVFAFAFGIVFQYFAIAPMRGLSFGDGIVAALKADTLSLTAWQIGMYGFMAFAQFYLFRHLLGVPLKVNTPEFWFVMQIAMLAGFCTSYPVNWWLIRVGIKERM